LVDGEKWPGNIFLERALILFFEREKRGIRDEGLAMRLLLFRAFSAQESWFGLYLGLTPQAGGCRANGA